MLAAMVAVGAASMLVYAVWVAWVPLLPDDLYIPLLDLGKMTGYRWSSAIQYLLIVLGLYALYAVGYGLISRDRRNAIGLGLIVGGSALFCFELIWAYPATAVDVFAYVADGRLLALHNVNPFTVAPNAFPSDPIIPYLAFPDEPAQYGPLWVLLGGAFATLSEGDLLKEVLLYKAVAVAAHLGSGALTYLIARRLSGETRIARLSAYLYLWNPMLLWEMVGNAHNDGFMMLLGLVAVWLFVAGFDLLVLGALAAATLVKVPVAIIGPVLLVGLLRRSWARAIESALLGLALAAAVYRPFWEGPDTLTALQRTDLFTASFGSVLRLTLEPFFGLSDASTIARTASLSGFAIVAVLALVYALQARTHDVEGVLRPAYFTLLGALLLATTWFQAWYVVWPFALGATLADPRRHLEVALLSLGGLLQYFIFIYAWVIGVFPPGDNLSVQSAAYLCIIGPLLIGIVARMALPWPARRSIARSLPYH